MLEVRLTCAAVKVLYTFDDQNKTNCLARWPQVLNVRTARLDESTQIGVVELKTCIQAIVTASPEIVAKLGQDYTVYAFDYSEYDIPLVGQGMLSWVLSSSSSTQGGPSQQSRAIVTGRVLRNVMGLFGNAAAETLEVKLRLVPMPSVSQSEYIDSMKKYRDLSKTMPENFDPLGWTDFLRMNPGVLSQVPSRTQSPTVSSAPVNMGIEQVRRLFNDGYGQQEGNGQPFHQRRYSQTYSQASSTFEPEEMRRGSPAPSMQSTTSQHSRRPLSRSASGLSQHDAPSTATQPASTGFEDGYVSFDDRGDYGPARKRAKVIRADHPGKKPFGKGPESLRVVASSAASVRNVFQPTAVRPGQNPAHALELPPRAPTPVARAPAQPRRPMLPTSRSYLSHESSYPSEKDDVFQGPTPGDTTSMAGSAVTSPEESRNDSAGSTPADIASSPPVGREHSMMPPSSPVLPAMRRSPQQPHADSGFVSGALDSLMEEPDGNEDRAPDAHDMEVARQYSMRPGLQGEQKPPADPTPEDGKKSETDEAMAQKLSRLNARRATQRLVRVGSDFAPPPTSEAPRLESEASTGGNANGCGSGRSQAPWDREKRRAAVQRKLAQSIEAGEMPCFCDNCGAIETPVWRRAYWRLHSGSRDGVQCSNVEGGVIGIQIVETNPDGSTSLFKIFKKSLLADDQDFQETLLCNRRSPFYVILFVYEVC